MAQSVPPWSDQYRSVSKAALDAWSQASPLKIIVRALRAREVAGDVAPGVLAAAITRMNGGDGSGSFFPYQFPPLMYACASGNVAAVRFLLRDSSGTKHAVLSQLAASDGLNASCAHAAAVRGLVSVLEALLEGSKQWDHNGNLNVSAGASDDKYIWALKLRDEHGRSPLDVAILAGPAGVGPRIWLDHQYKTAHRLDANAGGPRDNADHVFSVLDVLPQRASPGGNLWLRRFNATAHHAAGWDIADAATLRGAGLPPGLTCLDASSTESVTTACTQDEVFIHTECEGSAPLVIAPSQLKDPTVLRELADLDLPFIVQTPVRRVRPREANDTFPGDVGAPHARYMSYKSVLSTWGDLVVDTGPIPYAGTYGLTNTSRVPLKEFVSSCMGRGLDKRQGTALLPHYIFDALVISKMPDLFHGLEFPSQLRKDDARMSQFIVGPMLSGAMPHFHGSAANLLIVGLKLWVIVSPAHAEFVQLHALEWFRNVFFKCYSFVSAEASNYTFNSSCQFSNSSTECIAVNGAPSHSLQSELLGSLPLTSAQQACQKILPPHYIFVQEPGDVVFVPRHFGHAVLNLADSIAIARE